MANVPLCICPSPHPNSIELPFSHKEKLAENKHIQKDTNCMKEKKQLWGLSIKCSADILRRHWFSLLVIPSLRICLGAKVYLHHPLPQIKTQVLLHSLEDVSGCEEMPPDRRVLVRSAGQCPPCPPLSARSVNSATCLAFVCLLLVTSLLKMVPKHMLTCRLVSLSTGRLWCALQEEVR